MVLFVRCLRALEANSPIVDQLICSLLGVLPLEFAFYSWFCYS